MTTFDDRQKAFEKQYVHDAELEFRANARSKKLLGLWAASSLGKSGADAEEYAKEVVLAGFESPGDDDTIAKIIKDFVVAGLPIAERDIRIEMERLHAVARDQIKAGVKG